MLKMAIFVEGQTEALFVHRLINEITTRHDIKITMANAKMPLVIEVGSGSDPDAYSAHISIKDYGGDGNVATQVRDNYNLLVSKGFSKIVGLRDIYPHDTQHIDILRGKDRRSLNYRIPTHPVEVQWVFSIRETEAWFLGDTGHFLRMDSRLTPDAILTETGYDLSATQPHTVPNPADLLSRIYRLAGKQYRKSRDQVNDVLNTLDFAQLYLNARRFPELHHLTDLLDALLTGAAANSNPPSSR